MKTFLGLAGIAFMTLATPAAAYNTPPDSDPHGDRTGSSGGSTPVPAPPVVILFGLAAGAVMMRRKVA